MKAIHEKRDKLVEAHAMEKDAVKKEIRFLELQFQRGRGSLSDWSTALLEDIDRCFVDNYMEDGEPVASLFYPHNGDNLNRFEKYCNDVDMVLRKTDNEAPRNARAWFTVYRMWEMRSKFPVPLGTASVVECLHNMSVDVRKGFSEVSRV
jgi:hypothetical protein